MFSSIRLSKIFIEAEESRHTTEGKMLSMLVHVRDERSSNTDPYHGMSTPLGDGRPLSSRSWEKRLPAPPDANLRLITHEGGGGAAVDAMLHVDTDSEGGSSGMDCFWISFDASGAPGWNCCGTLLCTLWPGPSEQAC